MHAHARPYTRPPAQLVGGLGFGAMFAVSGYYINVSRGRGRSHAEPSWTSVHAAWSTWLGPRGLVSNSWPAAHCAEFAFTPRPRPARAGRVAVERVDGACERTFEPCDTAFWPPHTPALAPPWRPPHVQSGDALVARTTAKPARPLSPYDYRPSIFPCAPPTLTATPHTRRAWTRWWATRWAASRRWRWRQ
jgi:hypothetical protein